MLIPALVMGEKKYSLDRKLLLNYCGEKMADVCHIPGIAVSKYISDQRRAYVDSPVEELLNIIKRAGEILTSENIDGESFDEYILKLSGSTGLPAKTSKSGLENLALCMRNINVILDREMQQYCISGLDTGLVRDRGGKLAISPYGRMLGVIAPSNHPSVHISWITALAMKYSVVIKAGRDDPFTPYRVIQALLKAGLNNVLVSMIPTEQESIPKIIDGCDRVIFYGSQKTISCYNSEKIISRGSGNSKIYFDIENAELNDAMLDIAVKSVMHDGGRRCTNASSIVIKGDAEKFSKKLAEKLFWELDNPINEDSDIGCFKSFKEADQLNRFIEENLGGDRDISAEVNGRIRLQRVGGTTYLNPTVILCDSDKSALYGKELPFPFVTVMKAGNQIVKHLSNSLAVTLVNAKQEVIDACLKEPSISKVILNNPTYSSRMGDPHDGFLFNHLYRVKSFVEEGELC